MATNPYASIALKDNPYASIAVTDDAAPTPVAAPQQTVLQKVFQGAGDVAKGVGEGALNTISSGDEWARQHLPAFLTNSDLGFGKPADLQKIHDLATPANTAQAVGKGLEQAGEFMIPGAAEGEAARGLVKAFPAAEKSLPLANILIGAGSSGAVNKLQGGSFGAGAAGGAIGAGVGQLAHAFAPAVAESALNIRKLDRAYGKSGGSIGRAILDETRGVTPGDVAESAQGRLDQLNPALNAAADRASVRQAPRIRGFLQPPVTETPLHIAGGAEGRLSEPVVLNQGDRPTRPLLQAPSLDTPLSEKADIFPNQRPGAATNLRHAFGEPAQGMGHADYIGSIPGEQGAPGQVQGVMRSRPPMSASIPRTLEPNPSASLQPARTVLSHAFDTAARQGERTTAGQLQPMATHLGETISGEPIPENVTPRQLLDLKRGFGNEFIHRWNPDTMTGVKGTAGRVYHGLSHAFEDAVPEAAPLNKQISNLIPIAKRAESEELNAPTAQRIAHRIGAHTGAMAGGIFGGMQGYQHGGAAGAIAGGISGMLLPELIASPTGEMMAARALNSGATRLTGRGAAGAALQLNRAAKKKGDDDE